MTISKESTQGGEDPYIWLEEVESDESIAFAKSANEKCLAQLGDPSDTETYKRVLAALDSDDRIPHVNLLGYEEGTGDMLLYNFWKDSKVCLVLPYLYCIDLSRNILCLTSYLFVNHRIQKESGAKLP